MAIRAYLYSYPKSIQITCESGDECGAVLDIEKMGSELVFKVITGNSVAISKRSLIKALKLLEGKGKR